MKQAGPDRRTRIAAWVVPIVISGEMMALAVDGPLLAASAAVAEILAAILVLVLVPPTNLFWKKLAPTLLLLVLAGAWLASGLGHWIAPDLTSAGVVRFSGGAAILVASAAVAGRRDGGRVAIDTWIGLGLILLAAGFVMNESDPNTVWGYDKGFLAGRFTATLLNANAAGCLFGILSVLGLGRLLTLLPRRLERRPLVVTIAAPVAVLAGIGACAITASRTALIATLVALVLVAASDRELRRYVQQRTGYAIALLVVLGIGVGSMVFVVGDVVNERFQTIAVDGLERTQLWAFYGRIVLENPLGIGPGGLDDATLHALRSLTDASQIWYVHSPHNFVLSLLLTGGWPYLALLVAAAGTLIWPVFRLSSTQRQTMTTAVSLSIGVILVCASVDIALDIPAFASLTAFLAGLAWSSAVRQTAGSTTAARAQDAVSSSSALTGASAGVPATNPVA